LYSGVAKRIASAVAQSSRRRRADSGVVGFEVLVVERQVAEPFPELELDAVGRGLDRSPQEARVERALPQAAGDGEDPHR
jgi:hypothetical protein